MQHNAASLFERAQRVIPGGVNSPVRAFNAVGGTPVYVERGFGCRLQTVEGREFIDFCGSWGPLILGHAHPAVVEAIRVAASDGTSFGINTEREVTFAEMLCRQVPSLERVRLVSSGTEATMTALRLARGFTGRRRILKFDGCYHGHVDSLLVSAGSGLLTGGMASSAGVTPGTVADVLVAPYNDLAAVEMLVAEQGDDLAAVIVEPMAGNMGLVPPDDGFLAGLRAAADRCGTLLIFDEVISGFRLGPTTYGEQIGVPPDLTCLGKIIGGGMPIGAVGGRAEIMERLAPCGDVYQAGTLSGNPVAVAAGMATLQQLVADPPYARLAARGVRAATGLRSAAESAGVEVYVANVGGMFTVFFQGGPVRNLVEAKRSDTTAHARWFHGLLERGIYLPPSAFEVCFISDAHDTDAVDALIEASRETWHSA